MTQDSLYIIASIGLFGIGLYGVIVAPHILKKILAINIMSVGVFMLLVESANNMNSTPDPVLHAMVLTGIVVAIAGTALALLLAVKIHTLSPASDKDGH
ncbi:NADH-quinone oxidoreductase subunit K [Marinobacter psychrophilus]|jgi:multicomponent Na+:H+ antiporter subunit C|uniref:NADH-quinone oxidoreductase subunit K n=1 Tax=Marinobacter psychrophilus TaxID=330734 RepID=UPI001B661525|nr:NADH-quinone oxidoreductase subunit K [Marinobacter psychrophilus]MBQ0763157.1 NADH-quinone oxidoreductase subunit K [Marinobacter psychrophilus]MBQ0843952.1 NADH-quinone oxidoreductase subunit K [Marinobacter psychrophilus]